MMNQRENEMDTLAKVKEIYPEMELLYTDGTEFGSIGISGDIETYVVRNRDGSICLSPKLWHGSDGKWRVRPESTKNMCGIWRSYLVETLEEALVILQEGKNSVVIGDDRSDVIARARKYLLWATNIGDSPEEMAVLDSFLMRCQQVGWLDRFDASQWVAFKGRLSPESFATLIKLVHDHTRTCGHCPCLGSCDKAENENCTDVFMRWADAPAKEEKK